MRLRSLDIDGFGVFERLSSGELPGGLVVLYSADERRKDTALAFVRGLLFGMNNGNWPLAGAPAGGGAVQIDAPQGSFLLRRAAGAEQTSLVRPDGQIASADEMAALLAGVANGSTRRFFDIGLEQLRAFATPGNVAGDPWRVAADAERSERVLAAFRTERSQILGGSAARIDRLLASLADADEALRAARAHDDECPALMRREAELRQEISKLCGELAEQRKARERYQLIEELWPGWNESADAQRSLDVLEPIDEFPDEALSLVDASRHLAATRLELHRLEHARDRGQRSLADMPDSDDRYLVLADIETLCAETSAYRSRLSTFATARARHGELTRLLPESARRVAGPEGETSFDPARLDLQEARRWQVRAQQLAESEATTRTALETTRAAVRQLRAEQAKAVREADPTSLTMNPLDRRWLSLWRLRRNLDELWEVQSQGEARARRAEEREAELEARPSRHWRIPPRWIRVFIWTFVGGAFAATLYSVGSEQKTRTMLFGSLAFAGMLGDLVLAWRSRVAEMRNTSAAADDNRLRWELAQMRETRDQCWRRAGDIAAAIQNEARQLGLPEVPEDEDIAAYQEQLWRESTARLEVGVLTQIALTLATKIDEEAMLATQVAEVREARAQTANDWGAWKVSVGLPAHLAEEQLSTYLCEFDRWRELRREVELANSDLRDLGPEIETWEQRARATLARSGVNVAENLCGRDLVDQLTTLRESARRSDRRQRRRADLERECETLATDIETTRARLAAAEAKVEQLARTAGTDDHDEFERRRRVFDRRRQLRGEIEQHQRRLDERLAHLSAGERHAVRGVLANGDRGEWREAVRRIDETLPDLEAALRELSRQQIEAAATCRQWEESTATVEARQQRAAVLHELAEAAREWRCLAVAEALLEATVGDLHGQRDSALLAAASQLLANGGTDAFTQIKRGGDGAGLRLVDTAGRELAVPGEVDRAVAEQLCLSLHLVSARDLARRGSAPPLLLDDVLRDLDTARHEHMADEIARLAAAHQVLYFSSHLPTVERLRAANARLVEV